MCHCTITQMYIYCDLSYSKLPKRMAEQTTLRRVEVREILQRHKGSIKEVAESLGVNHASVSMWLGGRTKSKRVAEAATLKALQLQEQERTAAANEELKRTA